MAFLSPSRPVPRAGHRLVALDWMRGLVMVLMAFDHASEEVNAGRVFTDGVFFYQAGTPLPLAQFLARWMTHLCAPTFVFLAGASLAMSIDRRTAAGESAWDIDRYLLTRGVVIAGFELWVSLFWMPGRVLFQVLYAIGSSLIFMAALRRLPTAALVALGVAILALGEGATAALGWGPPAATPVLAALLLVPGRHGALFIAYPTLPWLAIMLFGWATGRLLQPGRGAATPVTSVRLALSGLALLGLFAVVRGFNAYGNAGLLRDDGSLAQWLHVSKYPPSVSFASLELGVMALVLAGFTAASERVEARPGGLLLVLGRTPMFFYLLHIPLLVLVGHGLGIDHRFGLGATFLFAAVAVAALFPACRWYGRYKATGQHGWTRYV